MDSLTSRGSGPRGSVCRRGAGSSSSRYLWGQQSAQCALFRLFSCPPQPGLAALSLARSAAPAPLAVGACTDTATRYPTFAESLPTYVLASNLRCGVTGADMGRLLVRRLKDHSPGPVTPPTYRPRRVIARAERVSASYRLARSFARKARITEIGVSSALASNCDLRCSRSSASRCRSQATSELRSRGFAGDRRSLKAESLTWRS